MNLDLTLQGGIVRRMNLDLTLQGGIARRMNLDLTLQGGIARTMNLDLTLHVQHQTGRAAKQKITPAKGSAMTHIKSRQSLQRMNIMLRLLTRGEWC